MNAEWVRQKGGEEVANKLKDIRLKNEMTQAELAEKSGVSRQTIIGIENGTRVNVNTGTLVKLSNVLNCSLEELFS